jgi:hypothetical protein
MTTRHFAPDDVHHHDELWTRCAAFVWISP